MGKNDPTKTKILNPRDANKNWSFIHKEDSIVLKQNGGTVKICWNRSRSLKKTFLDQFNTHSVYRYLGFCQACLVGPFCENNELILQRTTSQMVVRK